jgi:hypothetical protein
MSRIDLRRDYKKNHKKLNFGSWQEFNSGIQKQQPFVNQKKRILKGFVKDGMSYKYAKQQVYG